VTAGGPKYRPLLEMDADDVREALSDHVVLGLEVARNAVGKMRPGARCCSWAAPVAGASVRSRLLQRRACQRPTESSRGSRMGRCPSGPVNAGGGVGSTRCGRLS
jgi:hypothetical protein